MPSIEIPDHLSLDKGRLRRQFSGNLNSRAKGKCGTASRAALTITKRHWADEVRGGALDIIGTREIAGLLIVLTART